MNSLLLGSTRKGLHTVEGGPHTRREIVPRAEACPGASYAANPKLQTYAPQRCSNEASSETGSNKIMAHVVGAMPTDSQPSRHAGGRWVECTRKEEAQMEQGAPMLAPPQRLT